MAKTTTTKKEAPKAASASGGADQLGGSLPADSIGGGAADFPAAAPQISGGIGGFLAKTFNTKGYQKEKAAVEGHQAEVANEARMDDAASLEFKMSQARKVVSAMNAEALMMGPYSGQFRAFAASELSDENIDFIRAIDKGGFAGPGDLKGIYETFVPEGSPRQVNIDSGTRTKLDALARQGKHQEMNFAAAREEILRCVNDTRQRALGASSFLEAVAKAI